VIKDLIIIANTLDSKGLCKEADALDQIIKESLDGSGLLQHVESAPPSSGKGVYELLMGNPEVLEVISIFGKVAAAGAIVWPDPVTTAGGIAAMKGTMLIDITAAIGYFKKGENLNGFFNLLSAAITVPAGAALRAFNLLKSLRSSGGIILLAKHAPARFIAALSLGVEGLISIIGSVTEQIEDKESNLAVTILREDPSGRSEGGIKAASEEIMAELWLIKDHLSKTIDHA